MLRVLDSVRLVGGELMQPSRFNLGYQSGGEVRIFHLKLEKRESLISEAEEFVNKLLT